MKFSRILLVFIALFPIILTGCGSDKPVASGLPSGNGYKIELIMSNTQFQSGDSAIVTAKCYTPNGMLAPVEEGAVWFACSGGELEFENSGPISITYGGTAITTVKWIDNSSDDSPSSSSQAVITASYHGALASIEITLVSKSF